MEDNTFNNDFNQNESFSGDTYGSQPVDESADVSNPGNSQNGESAVGSVEEQPVSGREFNTEYGAQASPSQPTDAGTYSGYYGSGSQQPDYGYYQRSSAEIIQDDLSGQSHNSGYDRSQYGYQPRVTLDERERPKKSHGFLTVFLSVLLSAVIAVGGSFAVVKYYGNNSSAKSGSLFQSSQSESSTVENVNINIDEEASSIAQAVSRKCNKSVVGIRTTISTTSFFGGSNSSTGEGSGVIYTKDGYIITNYHVIKSALSYPNAKIDVYLESVSTKPYSAKVIGYNIASDLAVLKIEASGLTPVQIGDSDKLSVGQYAITIGAPGGLEFMGSVTYGIISGLNRVVSSDSSIKLIQTDAAINPGNSGGALLDETGSLIGINSSKIVSEEFEGMGFAIPVNTVVKICDSIIKNKDKAEPYDGITISEKYTADVLEEYGYPTGAVVLSVAEGSTAETCGIRRGDIITKFNGVTVKEYTDYYKALKNAAVGSEVEIEIYRSGRYYQANLAIVSNSSGD